MMRLFCVVAAVGLWATAANSAPLGFTCDNQLCSCDVNIAGDCDAMKKNCSNGTILTCVRTKCECPVQRANPRPSMGPTKPPTIRQ
jgi:hypothetical protein